MKIDLSLEKVCGKCHGAGSYAQSTCPACGGSGSVPTEFGEDIAAFVKKRVLAEPAAAR